MTAELPLLLLRSFSVSLVSMIVLSRLAHHVDLVDAPDHRKHHDDHVPLVGGMSIFLGTGSAFLLLPVLGSEITSFLISAILIVAIGVLDDQFDLKVRYRLFIQFVAALVLTVGGGMVIESLGTFGSGGELQLGIFAIPFTMFSIMVAINAFNFLDGIDGLSGLMFLVSILAMIMLMPVNGGSLVYITPLIFIVAVIPYMAFNLGMLGKHNKILLGDAGSMLLGLIVVWLLIDCTQGEYRCFSPVTALWITAVPLMDMLAIVTRRAANGRAPFEPDRNHLHHLFMDHGMNDRQALVVIGIISVIFACVGIASEHFGFSQTYMLAAFLLIFFAYYRLMAHFEEQAQGATS